MQTYPTISLQEEFLLNPEIIYLNHGSFGATPRPVFERYQQWQRELEFQPTEFLGRRARALMQHSREALAEYLHTDNRCLAYVVNATYGLNVIARGLTLGPGDEVLATDHEYGALDRTFRYMAKKQGFQYTNQPIPTPVASADAFVEALWRGVTPHTKVIFISHITSPTALIFPVAEVCRRARAEGILTIVDGAHAPGQIPLDLDALGADFYSGNLHKWLCAPKGAAFLYARPEHLNAIQPLVVSWGYESDDPGPSPLVDYVETQGTRDLAAFLSIPDAIAYQRERGWDSVRARCHALAADTVRRICAVTGQAPLSPLTTEWFAQMASAPLPPTVDVAALKMRLYDVYRIEIPILTWNDHKLARVSIQGYNTPEDADALVEAIKKEVG